MTIQFRLEESDLLNYQLYANSLSLISQRRRQRARWVIPVLYVVFAAYFMVNQNWFGTIFFVGFAALWFAFYPYYDRKRHLKHFREFVKDRQKESIGKEVELTFRNDSIFTREKGGEGSVLHSEIKGISELGETIIILLNSSRAFIIPKKQILELDRLRSMLHELATELELDYYHNENWQWQ